VSANDPAQWAWTKSQAFIENNCETLTDEDVAIVLEDAMFRVIIFAIQLC